MDTSDMNQSIRAPAGTALILGAEGDEFPWLRKELAAMSYSPMLGVLDTNLLLKEVSRHEPALLLLLQDEPQRRLFECVRLITSLHPTPMLMFGFRANPDDAVQALNAGVSQFVAARPSASLLKVNVQSAITAFSIVEDLRGEVRALSLATDERRTVDQAKFTVMRVLKLNEPSAYAYLRKEAMDSSQPIVCVAQRIIQAMDG